MNTVTLALTEPELNRLLSALLTYESEMSMTKPGAKQVHDALKTRLYVATEAVDLDVLP